MTHLRNRENGHKDEVNFQTFFKSKLPFQSEKLNKRMVYTLEYIIPSQDPTYLKVWVSLLTLPKEMCNSFSSFWLLYGNGKMITVDLFNNFESDYICNLIYLYFNIQVNYSVTEYPSIILIKESDKLNNSKKAYEWFESNENIYTMLIPPQFHLCCLLKNEIEESLMKEFQLTGKQLTPSKIDKAINKIVNRHSFSQLEKIFYVYINTFNSSN